MQPNPANTTNILVFQMINIMVNGPDAVNISTLSPSTTYSSSTAWMQALSFASLAFSVLAAFGAVMGKQWLNSFKVARGRGSLEECGMKRQRKLNRLEYWRLQTILRAFLILLQISLFLFGLSLSANMWTQQAISIVIICATAIGLLFYVSIVVVAVLDPDSPFQTAGSALVAPIYKKFLTPSTPFNEDPTTKLSAISWLLETSTKPDVVEAVAAMVPLVQWPRDHDASAIYTHLRDTFTAYHHSRELFVKCGKAMAHLCLQQVKIDLTLLRQEWETWDAWGGKSLFICDAFIAGRSAWKELRMTNGQDERKKLKADARTALRTMVVHGQRGHFSRPDDEKLIWDGDLQWCHKDGRTPCCEEFDWLVDYLVDRIEHKTDEETQRDALLALSAMHGLGSDAKRHSYVKALIHCMDRSGPQKVRYAAIRAISDAREELSSITSDSMLHGVDAKLLNELSRSLLAAVHPNDGFDECDPVPSPKTRCYLRLIFSLAKNHEWCKLLSHNPSFKQWFALIEDASPRNSDFNELDFYRVGIYLRTHPGGIGHSFDLEKWGARTRRAWSGLSIIPIDQDFKDCLKILPALVEATKRGLHTSLPTEDLRSLSDGVNRVLEMVTEDEIIPDALLSFRHELNCMLGNMDTS